MIKLVSVEFFIGCGCCSAHWLPGMGVGYKKKTVLHSVREVIVEFVFRKLKVVRKRWEGGGALILKTQPWWFSQFQVCSGSVAVQQVLS